MKKNKKRLKIEWCKGQFALGVCVDFKKGFWAICFGFIGIIYD